MKKQTNPLYRVEKLNIHGNKYNRCFMGHWLLCERRCWPNDLTAALAIARF
jgi:hypothetical protein